MNTLLSLLWRALPYAIAIAVAAAVVWFIYGKGVSAENQRRVAEVTALKVNHNADLLRISNANSQALAKAQTEARDKEEADRKAMAALDEKHFKELQHAKDEAQRTIDGLRNGALRVRSKYACTPAGTGSAAGGVPQASTGTGMGDGATIGGFGLEDAAAVIGAADQGDRWATQLLACQAIVRHDRGQ